MSGGSLLNTSRSVVSQSSFGHVFGNRTNKHTIIVASGDTIRHWTIRPWMVGVAACFLVVMSIGYLSATTYLVLRDDLVGAAVARQARMQHAYEDRIATLRSQVDRITSRQLLDQRLMENRMAELLQQQERLSSRHGHLDLLLQNTDVVQYVPARVPIPTERPDPASLTDGDQKAETDLLKPPTQKQAAGPGEPTRAALSYARAQSTDDKPANAVFEDLLLSLQTMEEQQAARIHSLSSNAYQTADAIKAILRQAGIPTELATGVGGPLVTSANPMGFETSLDVLGDALHRLDKLRDRVIRLPLGNPAPNRTISSGFGKRRDPFLNRLAHHAGIDFRMRRGEPVLSSGSGTVVRTGRNGGYGKMVEIDHGEGFTTRYAHLSRISVKVGEKIDKGDRIGASGNTGRSTGPHLHYEVRYRDRAINPKKFLHAGRKLQPLL